MSGENAGRGGSAGLRGCRYAGMQVYYMGAVKAVSSARVSRVFTKLLLNFH